MLPRSEYPARFLHALERFALRRADLVFLDTQAHARRIETLFGLATGSAEAVWVGAETEHFHVDAIRDTAVRAPNGPPANSHCGYCSTASSFPCTESKPSCRPPALPATNRSSGS